MWQDYLFTVGGIVFIIALVPMLFSKDKPKAFSSFSTGIILLSFCIAYYSFNLWFTFSTTLITGTVWLILGVQKVRNG